MKILLFQKAATLEYEIQNWCFSQDFVSMHKEGKKTKFKTLEVRETSSSLELVSKELNHFGVIADLFRQIGVYTPWFVLFALFEDFSLGKWLKVQ